MINISKKDWNVHAHSSLYEDKQYMFFVARKRTYFSKI